MAAPLISGSLLLAQELYLDRFSVLPSVDDLMQWMTLGGTAFVDTGNTFTAIDVLGFLNEIPLNTVPLPGTQWLLAAFIPPILRPRRRLAQGRLIGIALTEVLHLQRPALPILSPGHHPGTVATVRHKHPRPSDPVRRFANQPVVPTTSHIPAKPTPNNHARPAPYARI